MGKYCNVQLLYTVYITAVDTVRYNPIFLFDTDTLKAVALI